LIGIKDIRVELVKKFARESSVFKNKIKIKRKHKRPISLVTFVTTSPMNALVNERSGELGFFFKENYGYFPDDSKTQIREKYKDFYFRIINDYFKLIKETFPDEWEDSENYILATDRGIRVFLRLLRLIIDYNVTKQGKKFNDIEITKNIISSLKGFNFKIEDLKGKYFGEGGADIFLEDLKAHIQKSIDDFFPKEQKKLILEKEIESSDKEEAERLMERWLPKLGDQVYGELSYIDSTTFDFFKLLPKRCKIKLLVSIVKDLDSCIKKYDELKNQGFSIEIKRITKPSKDPAKEGGAYLHERWIGGNEFEVDIGADMKKSALGGKKHTFRVFGNVINSKRLESFKERWRGLSKFKEREILIENLFS
jgi:hypothetical protein